jgi:pimeloyl-ACP methyl ester carboxylesterase
VDRVSVGGIIVHGNSVSSQIAMQTASQRPDRVLALIISGTGYPPPRESLLRWIQRYKTEGDATRIDQVLDHFAPKARERAYLRHYADGGRAQ